MAIFSEGQVLGIAQEVGLHGNSATIAAAIAMAESGGNTSAENLSSVEDSIGLWQINLKAHPQYTRTAMQDPLQNALAMYSISNGGTNWNPWSTYTNGAYRKYLSSGITPVTYTGTGSLGVSSGGISTLSSAVRTNKAVLTDTGSAWAYILAYTVAILIFTFIAKFEAGYNALYYMAVLTLLFLLLTQSRFIANALAPITNPQQDTTAVTTLV